MPISTVWILKYLQQCYVKWFWTISSFGAPAQCNLYVQSERNQVNSVSFYVNENSKTTFRWSRTFLQKESNKATTKTSRGNIILALNELTPKQTYKWIVVYFHVLQTTVSLHNNRWIGLLISAPFTQTKYLPGLITSNSNSDWLVQTKRRTF